MRAAVVLAAVLLGLSWGGACAADDSRKLLRPSPRVLMDPAAYYSPLLFTKKAEPKPGEWMAEHPEPRQSFNAYTGSGPIRPTRGRHTLVLSPLGPMGEKEKARFGELREFLEVYYTLPVRLGEPLGLAGVTSREKTIFGRTLRQYLTGDILYQVLRPALPSDAMCLLGVTMEDLYPEPSWNYVFGQALLTYRVGVYSLVRFYPAFWGFPETDAAMQQGFGRSLRTLVHETGHMFGVHHCQQYDCVMNGSNSLPEADARPIHLCPVCLQKFRWNIGFDLATRYEGLRKFYEAHAMTAEAAWAAKRIRQCRGEKVTPADGKDTGEP